MRKICDHFQSKDVTMYTNNINNTWTNLRKMEVVHPSNHHFDMFLTNDRSYHILRDMCTLPQFLLNT